MTFTDSHDSAAGSPDPALCSDGGPPGAPDPGERSGADVRSAFGRLTAVLTDVASTADRSVRERCPHRGVRSRCHYRARCRNQVKAAADVVCGGDALVRFDPVTEE